MVLSLFFAFQFTSMSFFVMPVRRRCNVLTSRSSPLISWQVKCWGCWQVPTYSLPKLLHRCTWPEYMHVATVCVVISVQCGQMFECESWCIACCWDVELSRVWYCTSPPSDHITKVSFCLRHYSLVRSQLPFKVVVYSGAIIQLSSN